MGGDVKSRSEWSSLVEVW